MAIITIVGSGMMGSAIGIPASENGHEVRLVGTPLDREIIEHARKTGWHLNMRRQLPESYKYYQFEELSRALEGADAVVCGVSSFGSSGNSGKKGSSAAAAGAAGSAMPPSISFLL